MAFGDGTVQDRYDREYLQIKDTRKQRAMDHRRDDRRTREFVDPDTMTTVTATGDNNHGTVTVRPA